MSAIERTIKTKPSASITSFDLHKQIEAAKLIRSQMADIAANDPEFLVDIIEGQTDLQETIASLVESVVVDGAVVSGIEDLIGKLKGRCDRIEKRTEMKRALIALGLEVGGLSKIETPGGTVSAKTVPPKVIITEEADIPARFWKPADPTLDKKAIGAALKERAAALNAAAAIEDQVFRSEALALADKDYPEVAGATLSNGGYTIAIRT